MRNLTLFLIAALIAAAAFASEDYYVWVDENGVTNYSQNNPRGHKAKHVTGSFRFGERDFSQAADAPGQGRPQSAAGNTDESGVDPDQAAAEQRSAVAANIAATKQKNCETGKRNLAQLQSYSKIRMRGPDGKERVLSQQERQDQINEARQIIRDNCSG